MSSYKVPLYSKSPGEGSIEYLAPKSTLDKTDGFFSFTFYIRDIISGERTPKEADLYLKGMNYYHMMLGKTPFENWKLIIYTDQFTYSELVKSQSIDVSAIKNQSDRYRVETLKKFSGFLLNSDSVIFAIVTWPRHQRRKGVPQINGGALRSLRSRAPFDFPDKFIFIRDADTFFELSLKRLDYGGLYRTAENEYNAVAHQAVKDTFRDQLYSWEKTFFENIPAIQESVGKSNVLIVGTGKAGFFNSLYKRDWHANELEGKDSPFGIFAGLISVTPGVPVYQNMSAWDDFIDYVNRRSIRNEEHPVSMLEKYFRERERKSFDSPLNKEAYEKYKKEQLNRYGEAEISELEKNIFYFFSNNTKIHRIGRDEQLYLFIIMPRSLENLFIFKSTLDDLTPPIVDVPFNTERKANYMAAVAGNFRRGGTRKQKKPRSTRKKRSSKKYL